jgi:hypothetical protein
MGYVCPTIQGSMVDVHFEIQYLYILDNLMGMVEVVVTLLFPTVILWKYPFYFQEKVSHAKIFPPKKHVAL